MEINTLCDTFEQDIFKTLTKKQQNFYLKISILDTLFGPLCDAVTGYHGCSRILEKINSLYNILIPQDDERKWYRYHSQLKDFFYLNLVKNENIDVISRLHRKAAGWYQSNGYISLAIKHYLSGRWYEDAVKLIETQTNVISKKCDYTTAISLIEQIPEEYRQSSLEIAYIYAFYYTEMRCFEKAKEWIARMDTIAACRKNQTDSNEWEYMLKLLVLTKANLTLKEEDIEDSVTMVKGAVSDVRQRYQRLDFVDINLYDIYLIRNPMYKMMQFLKTGSSGIEAMYDDYSKLLSKNVGYAPLAEGEFLYESNKLSEALPHLLEAMEGSMDVGCPGVLVPVMVTIAKVHKAQGNIRGAFEALEECEYKLQSCKNPHWGYLLSAFKARMYLDSNDIGAAGISLKSSSLGIYHEITRAREFKLIVFSRLLIAKGLLTDADILLKRLLKYCKAFVRRHSTVEILNLLAITSYKNNQDQLAMTYLKKSLAIGMSEGYIRSFADEMEEMMIILSRFKEKDDIMKENEQMAAYVDELLDHIVESIRIKETAISSSASKLIQLLTPQEYNILHMLGDACTNEEIGEKLGITLRTVKAHAGSIYTKMGVKSRAQCIKQAREIGLI